MTSVIDLISILRKVSEGELGWGLVVGVTLGIPYFTPKAVLHSICPIAYQTPIILCCTNKSLPLPFIMSHTPVSSSYNFQLIINNALEKYKKRTKTDLVAHPLVAQLQSCNSPNDIIAILQQQVQALDQSRSSDERWSRWLNPTVNVIYALSSTVAAGVGLVCLGT